MTQDQDDYMRRQEMDHDLLRQRDPNHTQRVGRALRTPGGFPPRTFEFDTPKPPPLLTDEERVKITTIMTGQGIAQGTADMCLHFMMPTLQAMVQRHRDEAYRDGERGGMTRVVNTPGNGDMGG